MGGDEPASKCVFCQRPFKRHDAVRRHWQTCHVRRASGLDVPHHNHKTRGRKPKSCDRCVRLKRVCSATDPCTTCVRNEASCIYSRHKVSGKPRDGSRHSNDEFFAASRLEFDSVYHHYDGTTSEATPLEIAITDVSFIDYSQHDSRDMTQPNSNQELSLVVPAKSSTQLLLQENVYSSSLVPRPTQLDIDALRTFPFLGNLVCGNGLGPTFQSRFLRDRTAKSQSGHLMDSHRRESYYLEGPVRDLQTHFTNGSFEQGLCGGLAATSRGILDIIIPAIEQHIGGDPGRGMALELQAWGFFSPSHIGRHLNSYWSSWHSNWPVIHKPSFSPGLASPLLVAAMSAVGACLSPDPSDRATVQQYFDILELLIFDRDTSRLCADGDCVDPLMSRHRLEMLQAAYCVVLFQTWEGSLQARKRARTYRYDRIVSMARAIGFDTGSLAEVDTTDEMRFDWSAFAHQESLVRTFAYVANLDSGMAMFYRQRPRMMVSDMVFDLSAPQAAFWAESATECYAKLRSWRSALPLNTNISLASAVNLMCSNTCLNSARRLLERLSVLDMFTIISALYTLAYHVESSMSSFLDITPLRRGLHNWQKAWPSEFRDHEILGASTELPDWKRVGFFRYAPEYWLMTSLVLERAYERSRNGSMPDASTSESDDANMSQLNALIGDSRWMNTPSITTG